MLAEALADPALARRIFPSILGTVFPFQGGMPCTAGKIAKFASGSCTDLTDSVIVEDANGRIGIGKTNPAEKLDINGSIVSKGLSTDGTHPANLTVLWIQQNSAQTVPPVRIRNKANTDDLFTILPDGNVGIGKTNPTGLLDVNGNIVSKGLSTDGTHPADLTVLWIQQNSAQTAPPVRIRNKANTDDLFTILPDGQVGIGKPNPAELLDVNGNILSKGLNQIVFLKPSGGDDGEKINDAIQSLPPEGGIIMLTPGTYNVSTTITNIRETTKRGVKLRGYGAAGLTIPPQVRQTPVTQLKWTPSTLGTVIKFESNVGAEMFQDFEVSDLTIEGNGNAGTALHLNRVATSKFVNLQIANLKRTQGEGTPSVGILLTVDNASQLNQDCAWNLFLNCTVYGADQGLVLRSDANFRPGEALKIANCAHNTFVGLSVWYYGDDTNKNRGIVLGDCDNNSFYRVWDCVISGQARGYAVSVERDTNSDVTPPVSAVVARSNYFYHLQAIGSLPHVQGQNGSFLVNANPGDTVGRNFIYGYDLDNGEVLPESSNPSTNVAEYLLWIDSKGDHHTPGTLLLGAATAPKQVSGGPELISFQHPEANHVVIASFVGTETKARLLIDMQGNHEWAGPTDSDQNVLLGWSAVGRLNLSGTSGGGLNIVRWIPNQPGVLENYPRIGLENDGSGIKLSDGTNAADVRLYRSTAPNAHQANLEAVDIGFVQAGDDFPRVSINTQGDGIKFGSGAAAPDVQLYRSQANKLAVDKNFHVVENLNVDGIATFGTGTSGTLHHTGNLLAFYGLGPVARGNVTGSRGNNAALASLLAKLALTGIIQDSTTA